MKIDEEFSKLNILESDKLPDLELYIDQVTGFLDDKLKNFKRYKDDKALTKTMINNYTKAKLLPLSTKKKYNKEHLMYLVLIYHLKSILSIEDISKVLNLGESHPIFELYDEFVKLQDEAIKEMPVKILKDSEKIKKLSGNNPEKENILSILNLIIEIELRKITLEKMIDELKK